MFWTLTLTFPVLGSLSLPLWPEFMSAAHSAHFYAPIKVVDFETRVDSLEMAKAEATTGSGGGQAPPGSGGRA